MRLWRITDRSGKTIFEWPKLPLPQDNRATVIIQFTNRMIADAIHAGASAVGLRPDGKHFVIDYVVNGVTIEHDRAPIHIYSSVVNRLKSMADLNYWRDDLIQTGTIKVTIDEVRIELKLMFTKTEIGDEAQVEITRESTSGLS